MLAFLGLLLVAYVGYAMVCGEVTVKTGIMEWREHGTSRVIRRDDSPREFRNAIACYSVVAALLLFCAP